MQFADVSFTNLLTTTGYDHFVSFMLSLTCVAVGLFSEVIGGKFIVKSANPELVEMLWKYAQLVFPLLIAVGYKSKSVFGLPFITVGLFKFGFPEIIGHYHFAFHPLPRTSTALRVANFINGTATLMHHSLATYVVCSFVVGTIVLNRHSESMVLPVITQHWFPILRYRYKGLYITAMLLTEVWWEMEVFSHLDYVETNAQIAVLGMVLAHWGYWTGGILEMLDELDTGISRTISDNLRRKSIAVGVSRWLNGDKRAHKSHPLERATSNRSEVMPDIELATTVVENPSLQNVFHTNNAQIPPPPPSLPPSLPPSPTIPKPAMVKKTRSECDLWRATFQDPKVDQPPSLATRKTTAHGRRLSRSLDAETLFQAMHAAHNDVEMSILSDLRTCMEAQERLVSALDKLQELSQTETNPQSKGGSMTHFHKQFEHHRSAKAVSPLPPVPPARDGCLSPIFSPVMHHMQAPPPPPPSPSPPPQRRDDQQQTAVDESDGPDTKQSFEQQMSSPATLLAQLQLEQAKEFGGSPLSERLSLRKK